MALDALALLMAAVALMLGVRVAVPVAMGVPVLHRHCRFLSMGMVGEEKRGGIMNYFVAGLVLYIVYLFFAAGSNALGVPISTDLIVQLTGYQLLGSVVFIVLYWIVTGYVVLNFFYKGEFTWLRAALVGFVVWFIIVLFEIVSAAFGVPVAYGSLLALTGSAVLAAIAVMVVEFVVLGWIASLVAGFSEEV